MEINYNKFGKRLRTARESRKLTQEQLSELTGLSNNYISNIERNRSIPSLETVGKICNVLEVTPDYLLCDSVYTSKEYIKDEIAGKLSQCNSKNLSLLSKFLSLLIEEQEIQEQYEQEQP